MAVSTATTRFWHPFADMGSVSQRELLIERGEGVWVWDDEGNRYLDGTASLWYANIGHGRADVAEAVARADGASSRRTRRSATSATGRPTSSPSGWRAWRRWRTRACSSASGGGDAIDTAAKIARRHWILRGQPERIHLISRTQGYHGTHGFGTSVGGIEANVTNWGPLVGGVSTVPFDSLEALEAEILRVGPDRVAAFFCEPVIGAGGVHPPPEGYIEGVADLCAEHGVLLVIDSVICGFGRLGTWYGIERWEDVKPDLITFAKGVTAGYLPLGGVVVSGEVAAPFFEAPGGPMLRHGATYAGHPTVLRRRAGGHGHLRAREPARRAGASSSSRCSTRWRRSPTTRRSPRCAAAVGCSPRSSSPSNDDVAKVAQGAREAGVLVRPLLGSIAVSPPLTVEREHLQQLADGIRAGPRPSRHRRAEAGSELGCLTARSSALARRGSWRRWSRPSRRSPARCSTRRRTASSRSPARCARRTPPACR